MKEWVHHGKLFFRDVSEIDTHESDIPTDCDI